ncbi:MAG TPA: lipase maturation factor family protein, partial [Myxococcaceae bacterium]|nr:lipase maturation factor family protein [Myxococcaceae bacterium]
MIPDGSRPSRPLLIFDGECGFCRRWVERWRARLGDRLDCAPFQEVADRFPSIPKAAFSEALHLVLPDGQVFRGADAVFRALALGPGGGGLHALYRRVPGFAAVTEAGYRFVARHRVLASKVTRALVGPDLAPATYERAPWLFLRLLAVVFCIAFASLWVQLPGLIGSGGIEPAAEMIAWLRGVGDIGLGRIPSLFWLGASDGVLHAACALGVVLSGLLFAGVAQRWVLLALWGLYLSFLPVSGPFLSYQWDILLLETALLSLAVAPPDLLPRRSARTPARQGALFLPRFLLFKLMLLSGVVKLASGDESWWSLRALEYHYWTQPLPTPVAFLVNPLPPSFHRAGVLVMFVIELVLPFFVWGTRRMRRAAAVGFALLQVSIAASGNYGFFNLLTLILCVPLVDDRAWARLVPRWRGEEGVPSPPPPPAWRRWGFGLFAGFVVAVSLAVSLQRFGLPRGGLPGPLARGLGAVEAFASINAYGLFAVMTTERPEIEVEGSLDGVAWRPYLLRYKPGPPGRLPAFVAPHQPRLDWQMWFAALGACESNPWFLRFQARLLEGSRPVLRLLAENPFPEGPPRYVRTTLYQYRPAPGGAPAPWVRE